MERGKGYVLNLLELDSEHMVFVKSALRDVWNNTMIKLVEN